MTVAPRTRWTARIAGFLAALLALGGSVRALAVDPKYKSDLNAARRQLLRGNYAEAGTIYKRLLGSKPFEQEASVGYAEALIGQEDYTAAETFLEEALAANEKKTDLYRVRGYLYRAQKQYEKSFGEVLRVLELDPERSAWATQETRQLLSEGMSANKAVGLTETARATRPTELNLPVLEAMILALDERPAEGLTRVTAAEETGQYAGRAVLRYAEELQNLGEAEPALAAFEVAASRTDHPAHRSRILFTVAELQEALENYRGCLTTLETIAAERKGNTAAGRALLKSVDIDLRYLDDPAGALRVYEQLKDDPILGHHRPDMLLQMADCYVRLDRLPEAAATYASVAPEALDPEQAEVASYKIAEVAFFAGDVDSAKSQYQTMAENYPRSLLADDAAHRYILLNMYGSLGAGELAAAYGRLEWARLVGDSAAVDSSAQVIITNYPDGELAAESWMALADLAVTAGQYELAVERLQKVSGKHAWDAFRAPRALFQEAELLATQLERPQDALQRYEKILTDYPQSVQAGDARRMVEKLRREIKS